MAVGVELSSGSQSAFHGLQFVVLANFQVPTVTELYFSKEKQISLGKVMLFCRREMGLKEPEV